MSGSESRTAASPRSVAATLVALLLAGSLPHASVAGGFPAGPPISTR